MAVQAVRWTTHFRTMEIFDAFRDLPPAPPASPWPWPPRLPSAATATQAATADSGSTAARACATNDLTFKITSKTQAGGYLLVTAKAKSGITCYLEGVFPSASFGSAADTELRPVETSSVSDDVVLSGSAAAYAGINPKSTNNENGRLFEKLHLSVTGDEDDFVTLDLPPHRPGRPPPLHQLARRPRRRRPLQLTPATGASTAPVDNSVARLLSWWRATRQADQGVSVRRCASRLGGPAYEVLIGITSPAKVDPQWTAWPLSLAGLGRNPRLHRRHRRATSSPFRSKRTKPAASSATTGRRAPGWPIGSGVLEGAARHLVADRLAITGSRWSVPGAEALPPTPRDHQQRRLHRLLALSRASGTHTLYPAPTRPITA